MGNTSSLEGGQPIAVRNGARIDAFAWALFFIWTGVCMLANLRWGLFLAGIGGIILAAQAALNAQGHRIDPFWLVCGAVFLAGGAWEILGLTWPLAPILLILLGVGILWKTFSGLPGPSA